MESSSDEAPRKATKRRRKHTLEGRAELKRPKESSDRSQSAIASSDESSSEAAKSKRKTITVYDAVDGRIKRHAHINDGTRFYGKAMTPQDVLFARLLHTQKSSVSRDDFYQRYDAAQGDGNDGLPDSDLLKAIHCYASDYYAAATPNRGARDWRSLDGTALIAVGILLEELCKQKLGESGDLAFIEGQRDDEAMLHRKFVKGEWIHEVIARRKDLSSKRTGPTSDSSRARSWSSLSSSGRPSRASSLLPENSAALVGDLS